MVSQLIDFATQWALEKPLTDMTLYENIFIEGNPIAILLTKYPIEILVIILSSLIGFAFFSAAFVILARFAKGEKFSDAVNNGVSQLRNLLTVSIILLVAFISLAGIFYFILSLASFNEGVTTIVGWALIIIYAIIALKLCFVLAALSEKKATAKSAFAKSWEFTNGKMIKTIILFILLGIILTVATLAMYSLMTLAGPNGEYAVNLIGEIIMTTFIGLALAYYYYAE
jgi:uncharacterized membrane protein